MESKNESKSVAERIFAFAVHEQVQMETTAKEQATRAGLLINHPSDFKASASQLVETAQLLAVRERSCNKAREWMKNQQEATVPLDVDAEMGQAMLMALVWLYDMEDEKEIFVEDGIAKLLHLARSRGQNIATCVEAAQAIYRDDEERRQKQEEEIALLEHNASQC